MALIFNAFADLFLSTKAAFCAAKATVPRILARCDFSFRDPAAAVNLARTLALTLATLALSKVLQFARRLMTYLAARLAYATDDFDDVVFAPLRSMVSRFCDVNFLDAPPTTRRDGGYPLRATLTRGRTLRLLLPLREDLVFDDDDDDRRLVRGRRTLRPLLTIDLRGPMRVLLTLDFLFVPRDLFLPTLFAPPPPKSSSNTPKPSESECDMWQFVLYMAVQKRARSVGFFSGTFRNLTYDGRRCDGNARVRVRQSGIRPVPFGRPRISFYANGLLTLPSPSGLGNVEDHAFAIDQETVLARIAMDEHVRVTAFASDEPVPYRDVEPFHEPGMSGHGRLGFTPSSTRRGEVGAPVTASIEDGRPVSTDRNQASTGAMDAGLWIDRLLNVMSETEALSAVAARARERERASAIVSNLPAGIPQRTPEWYNVRRGMITASEFKIAGAETACDSYVWGKIFPQPFPSNAAMEWGCRFEDLAASTYEFEHATTIKEFGLLVHPRDEWLGASPDGITAYGVAIEIKCPYSRRRVDIDKRVEENRPFPKSDRANLYARYAPQVQGQLEVCDLEVCDFVVAHIDKVDEQTFWQLRRVSDQPHRYAIVADVPVTGSSLKYSTSPLDMTDAELLAWQQGVSAAECTSVLHHVHVRELGVTRIRRDREKWASLRENLGRTKAVIDNIKKSTAGVQMAPGCSVPMFSPDAGDDVVVAHNAEAPSIDTPHAGPACEAHGAAAPCAGSPAPKRARRARKVLAPMFQDDM